MSIGVEERATIRTGRTLGPNRDPRTQLIDKSTNPNYIFYVEEKSRSLRGQFVRRETPFSNPGSDTILDAN